MDAYTIERQKIENALDSCGIGSDIQQRLDTIQKQIAVYGGQVIASANTQALHDALTNRPHRINNHCVGKTDAAKAMVSGIVSFLGALVEWDIDDARQIAAEILEDVNDHNHAAEIRAWTD